MRNWLLKLKRKAAPFRHLRGLGQWWLFARVFLFAAVLPLLFRLKIPLVTRLLDVRVGRDGAAAAAEEHDFIIRCVEWALLAGRPLVRPNCLTRGVTRYFFLRRAGVDLSLCFGAAWRQGELIQAPGHCWLVKDGKPYLEMSDPLLCFMPIYSLPPASRSADG